MQADNWIENILAKCTPIEYENLIEEQLVDLLIEKCYALAKKQNKSIGELLASAYDLLISAEYYASITHSGWLYCPDNEPRLFFHFTNCCPRHVLSEEFYFSPSNKPRSGRIGLATSRLLLFFINSIFRRKRMPEEILRGIEPVNAVIVNNETRKVLFAEIKASPLLTLSISTKTQRLTVEVDGNIRHSGHSTAINSNLYQTPIDLMVPKFENDKWVDLHFPLGKRTDESDYHWAYRGIIDLLNNDDNFFSLYTDYWIASLDSYYPKLNQNIFWLTNACGTPSPVPNGWKKRRFGSGYESVSDAKTSVGMDRTDDIKKGIYQVLKLGSEGKPFASVWDYKVAIISNIHPARHFEPFLESLKDIVWTNDTSGRAKNVKDLPAEQRVFNLFDGIIAFTKTYSRDEWIDDIFSNINSI